MKFPVVLFQKNPVHLFLCSAFISFSYFWIGPFKFSCNYGDKIHVKLPLETCLAICLQIYCTGVVCYFKRFQIKSK